MKIINRYLAREVYTIMFVVVLVLLLIFLSHQFVRYLHQVALGSLSYQGLKLLLLLQLPLLSAVLLPVGLFFAILLAYGRLYADSEMTIFIASGISPLYLLRNTFYFSLFIGAIVAFLSLWINPKVYNYSDRIIAGAIETDPLEMVKPNNFTSLLQDKWIFYLDSATNDKEHYSRIFAATQPQQDAVGRTSLSVVMAKKAYQKIDPQTGDLYIVLTDGYRYSGVPGTQEYEVIKYDEYAVRGQQDIKSWKADPSSIPTMQLWYGRHYKPAMAEFQWRLSLPLSVLVLTLLGVPLSKIKPKSGRYAKLVPAILLYITYANFLFLAKAWIKDGILIPIVGMWWVHGIMLGVATVLICQQVGWRKVFGLKGKIVCENNY